MKMNNAIQEIKEFMDWLSEQPHETVRKIYTEWRCPKDINFEKTIGNTNYVVRSGFNQKSCEDMISKIRRIILQHTNT